MTSLHANRPNTDLQLTNVALARTTIAPQFLNTPQFEADLLNRELGRRIVMKVETLNPIRSFKARGVGFALRDFSADSQVVCASSGNFGQAVAYVGRANGLRVRVHTARDANRAKRDRMRAFGAEVCDQWPDMQAARAAAVADAADPDVHLMTDGIPAAIAEGAATIAEELMRAGRLDAVVVPIGDGSLISGIGLWMRHHCPETRIIGVNPVSAPAMQLSFERGVATDVVPTSEFAEGISIARPHPDSVARVRALVDDVVLVNDAQLSSAMEMIATHLSIMAEPAGAAGLAAIATGQVDLDRVATIITGANFNPSRHLSGLAWPGRGSNPSTAS